MSKEGGREGEGWGRGRESVWRVVGEGVEEKRREEKDIELIWGWDGMGWDGRRASIHYLVYIHICKKGRKKEMETLRQIQILVCAWRSAETSPPQYYHSTQPKPNRTLPYLTNISSTPPPSRKNQCKPPRKYPEYVCRWIFSLACSLWRDLM